MENAVEFTVGIEVEYDKDQILNVVDFSGSFQFLHQSDLLAVQQRVGLDFLGVIHFEGTDPSTLWMVQSVH